MFSDSQDEYQYFRWKRGDRDNFSHKKKYVDYKINISRKEMKFFQFLCIK